MSYQVSRNGALYGPYTLEDLQRYVGTGNVLPTDLAKSVDVPETVEGVSSWIPVSQLLAASGATIPTPPYTPANMPPATYTATGIPYPDPPNLNWGIVLLAAFFTCGIFQLIWNLIIATWVRKVEPTSKALLFYIIGYVLLFANAGSSAGLVLASMNHQPIHANYLGSLVGIAAWVFRLVARFTLREDLIRHYNGVEPIGIDINPILTFFFGGVYFQYKLNQVNQIKQALRYRGSI
jgi:hypothetical protein